MFHYVAANVVVFCTFVVGEIEKVMHWKGKETKKKSKEVGYNDDTAALDDVEVPNFQYNFPYIDSRFFIFIFLL